MHNHNQFNRPWGSYIPQFYLPPPPYGFTGYAMPPTPRVPTPAEPKLSETAIGFRNALMSAINDHPDQELSLPDAKLELPSESTSEAPRSNIPQIQPTSSYGYPYSMHLNPQYQNSIWNTNLEQNQPQKPKNTENKDVNKDFVNLFKQIAPENKESLTEVFNNQKSPVSAHEISEKSISSSYKDETRITREIDICDQNQRYDEYTHSMDLTAQKLQQVKITDESVSIKEKQSSHYHERQTVQVKVTSSTGKHEEKRGLKKPKQDLNNDFVHEIRKTSSSDSGKPQPQKEQIQTKPQLKSTGQKPKDEPKKSENHNLDKNEPKAVEVKNENKNENKNNRNRNKATVTVEIKDSKPSQEKNKNDHGIHKTSQSSVVDVSVKNNDSKNNKQPKTFEKKPNEPKAKQESNIKVTTRTEKEVKESFNDVKSETRAETVKEIKSEKISAKNEENTNEIITENVDTPAKTQPTIGRIVNQRRNYSIQELMRAREFENRAEIRLPKSENNRLFLKTDRTERVVFQRSKNAWVSADERFKSLSKDELITEKCRIQIQRAINKYSKNTQNVVATEILGVPIKDPPMAAFLAECIYKSVITNCTWVADLAKFCSNLDKSFSFGDTKFLATLTDKFVESAKLPSDWLSNYEAIKTRKVTKVEELDRINEELQLSEQTMRMVLVGSAKFIGYLYVNSLLPQKVFEKFVNHCKTLKHDLEMEMICAFSEVLLKNADKIQANSKKVFYELLKYLKDSLENYPMRVQFIMSDVLAIHEKIAKNNKVTITNINSSESAKTMKMTPEPRSDKRNARNPSGAFSFSQNAGIAQNIGNSQNTSGRPKTDYFSTKDSTGAPGRTYGKFNDNQGRNDKNSRNQGAAQTSDNFSTNVGYGKKTNVSTPSAHVFNTPKSQTSTLNPASQNTAVNQSTQTPPVDFKKDQVAIEEMIGRFATGYEAEKFSDELKDYELSYYMKIFITKCFNHFVVKSKINHLYFGNLLTLMVRQGRLETSDILAGLNEFLDDFDDSIEDFPKLHECIAKCLLRLILLDIIKIDEVLAVFKEKGDFVLEKCATGLFLVISQFTCSTVFLKYWKSSKMEADLKTKIEENVPMITEILQEHDSGSSQTQKEAKDSNKSRIILAIENTWDLAIRISQDLLNSENSIYQEKYSKIVTEFFNLFFLICPMTREDSTEKFALKTLHTHANFVKILLADDKRVNAVYSRLNELQKSTFGYPPYLLFYLTKALVKNGICEMKTVESAVAMIENQEVQEEFIRFKASVV